MCIFDLQKDIYIASGEDACEFLIAHGIAEYQIEEFANMICCDDYETLVDRYESLEGEFECYEASLDAAQGLLNEILCFCDERLERERTKAGRVAYETIKDILIKSEVF